MPNKIIILRPKADCAEYIERIESMGYEAIAEEIMSVSFLDAELPILSPDIPLVFTSANGVRAFVRLSAERGHPVYTVGRNTAEEAQRAGFSELESASGTVHDLVELLIKRVETGLKSVFYVRGDDISTDFSKILAKNGIISQDFVAYKGNLSENMSIDALKSLKNRDVKAVLGFSTRGAAHFSTLVRQYGRETALKTAQALCLGEGVVESFRVLPFKEVVVAPTPDRYGMMSLLENLPNQNKE